MVLSFRVQIQYENSLQGKVTPIMNIRWLWYGIERFYSKWYHKIQNIQNDKDQTNKTGTYPANIITKWASLGHVTPLGQPSSVYKSNVECRFVSLNGQMTLKVRINDPHFQYYWRESQDAYLVQIWWFYLKAVTSYCMDKPNLLEF